MAIADTANLIVSIALKDNISGALGRINKNLAGLGPGLERVRKGTGQLASGFLKVGEIAAGAFAVGVGAAVKVAGDFEAQLNTINTISKVNQTQLTALGEGIRSTFRDTGVPLEELTSAYYDLLSAGVKLGDAQSVLNTAVKLGIGGLATTKESVDLLTTAINAYGLNASQAANASDIFAAAVRDGKVVVSELSASFADVAPLAAQTGIKLEEIGAAYAALTSRGVAATEVGTQFNRALIELLKPGPELVKVLKGLGLSSFDVSLKQKGLVATLSDVRAEATKLGIPFQDLFGRLEAYKFALATTGPNNAAFTAELAKMGDAAGETNAQFAERQQGLNFQLGKLKAAAQDAGITIGNALIPKLVPLLEKLNAFVQANQGKIEEFAQRLADGLSSFATKLGTIDFSGVIGGLRILGDVGKKVVDIFLSLPKGVQGALVAGFAVNKLSGGLLAKGAGNILGGAIKLVFERGSSPANPLWVQSVGGIGGGGPGGGLPFGLGTLTLAIGAAIGTYLLISGAEKEAQNPRNRTIISTPGGYHGARTSIPANTGNDSGLTAAAVREGTVPLVSAFERSRATSDDLYRLQRMESDRRNSDAARMLDQLRGQTTSLNQIAAKPMSTTVNVATTVTARLSVTQALQTQTIVNSIRYDGKTIPLF